MKFAIWGSGGMARAIRSRALLSLQAEFGESVSAADLVFVDDNPDRQGCDINGTKVISPEQVFALDDVRINVSFADPFARAETVALCESKSLSFFSIIDPTAQIFDHVTLGKGCIIAAGVIITSNVSIGDHVHVNIASYVEHDCVLEDFVTLSPRTSCNGYVEVGTRAFIGAGAIVKQGDFRKPRTIGAGAVVGMGAVVTNDVGAGTTVVGVPAKPIDQRRSS